MNGAKHIIQKELTRVFKDKKLVISLFVIPVVVIIGIYYFIGQMQTAMMKDIEEHVSTVYIQNAPEGFMEVMKNASFNSDTSYLSPGDDVTNVKKEILEGETDLLVVFEDNFLNKVKNYETEGRIPEVKTYYNNSEEYSNAARGNFVGQVLAVYQQQLLAERFGDLSMLTVFNIDTDPGSSIIVDNEKATGKMFGTLLPYFITFMLFTGAMSLGVDAIAGEKERGTMSSMLLTPLKRKEIVIGKLISVSILSSMSAAVYCISMIASMPVMIKGFGADNIDGLSLKFSPVQIIQLLIIMITLVYLYVAIVSLASVVAKSAKEASAYVTPIYLVVMIAGMITMFTGNGEKAQGFYAIPVYGSSLSIQSILVGELTLTKFGLTVGGTLLLSLFLTVIITKAFNSEKVMFNA